jgi:hypothetical protein
MQGTKATLEWLPLFSGLLELVCTLDESQKLQKLLVCAICQSRPAPFMTLSNCDPDRRKHNPCCDVLAALLCPVTARQLTNPLKITGAWLSLLCRPELSRLGFHQLFADNLAHNLVFRRRLPIPQASPAATTKGARRHSKVAVTRLGPNTGLML